MKQMKHWVLASTLTSGLGVAVTSCSNNIDNSVIPNERGQLLEVYDVQGSQGKARLTVNGKVIFTTDVYVGKKDSHGDRHLGMGACFHGNFFAIFLMVSLLCVA